MQSKMKIKKVGGPALVPPKGWKTRKSLIKTNSGVTESGSCPQGSQPVGSSGQEGHPRLSRTTLVPSRRLRYGRVKERSRSHQVFRRVLWNDDDPTVLHQVGGAPSR